MDLAVGHVAAVQKISEVDFKGWKAYNLGTGKGNSVLEVVEAFKSASGRDIPYDIAPRRAGDIAASFADCRLAEKELKWTAKKSLQDMCKPIRY
jgi:UDP-glucose 4-epimerase